LPFLVFGVLADMVAPIWPHEPIVRAYLLVLMLWIVIVSVAFYSASRLNSRLGAVTEILNIVSATLLVLALLPIVDFVGASGKGSVDSLPASATAALIAPAITDGDRPNRDIYHLVFDRYGSDEALLKGRGIDNSEFTEWLKARGFSVVENARANYERTALSLSSMLSMSLHDSLAATLGPKNRDLGPLYDRITNSTAGTVLQDQGYRYIHSGSWFSPTARSDIADRVLETDFEVSFVSTLVDRSAITGLDALATMATTLSAHGTKGRQADVTAAQFESLATIIEVPGPKYVFAHVLVPHEPYLFLEDGTFDPEAATYESQLHYANNQIKELIAPLLALPAEEQPIIILQADEGPYPDRYAVARDDFDWSTATPDELVTKFGVLNAMYLPGPAGDVPLPDGMSLVNTYPEVLRRYFGADIPDLPDRSYTLANGAPYDQTDITERLGAAFGERPESD